MLTENGIFGIIFAGYLIWNISYSKKKSYIKLTTAKSPMGLKMRMIRSDEDEDEDNSDDENSLLVESIRAYWVT